MLDFLVLQKLMYWVIQVRWNMWAVRRFLRGFTRCYRMIPKPQLQTDARNVLTYMRCWGEDVSRVVMRVAERSSWRVRGAWNKSNSESQRKMENVCTNNNKAVEDEAVIFITLIHIQHSHSLIIFYYPCLCTAAIDFSIMDWDNHGFIFLEIF